VTARLEPSPADDTHLVPLMNDVGRTLLS